MLCESIRSSSQSNNATDVIGEKLSEYTGLKVIRVMAAMCEKHFTPKHNDLRVLAMNPPENLMATVLQNACERQ